ncbi:MAG TPA: oligosaccharide flippase family protein [Candidatus Dormibacteraeota bacterium]|nr:oligosaccharide flippase family protein [Candidatus Dormibacteraeota bacterium]
MPDRAVLSTPPPLLRNIAFNVGARGVLIVLSIVVTPVLVRRLGTDRFGIYSLATGLGAGLTNVLALGLIPAIVATLSRALGSGNREDAQSIVRTSFTMFAVIGIIGAALVSAAVPFLVTEVLHIAPPLQREAAVALWISAVGLGLNLVFAVFTAIPYALQRYDIVAGRVVGVTLLTMAATVVYVLVVPNLVGVMVIQLLGGASGLLLYYLVSRRELTGTNLWPGFQRETFNRLGRFVAFKAAGDAALVFGQRFDQFAIGSLMNISAVGIYAVPVNACQRVLQLLGEVALPTFPRMSAVTSDEARRDVLLRGSRLVALIASLTAAMLLVPADLILRLWIGGQQGALIAEQATEAFRLLTLAIFIQAVAVVSALFCEALQRPAINNSFTVLGAVVQVPVILYLVSRYGINGAALGILIASVVQTAPLLWIVAERIARVSFRRLLSDALGRPFLAGVTAVLAGVIVRQVGSGLVALIVTEAAIVIVYAAVAIASGALRAGDLDQLDKVLPFKVGRIQTNPLVARILRP